MANALTAPAFAATLDYSVSSTNITASQDGKASFSITIPAPQEAYSGIQFAITLPSGASFDSITYNTTKGSVISAQQQETSKIWYFSRYSTDNVFAEELVCTIILNYEEQVPGILVIEEIKQLIVLGAGELETNLGEPAEITINPYSEEATVTYTIAVAATPITGGTVTGGGTYEEGASVTLNATANSRYRFTGWFESGTRVSTSAEYSIVVTANRILEARFGVRNIEPGDLDPNDNDTDPEDPEDPEDPDEPGSPVLILEKDRQEGYILGYPDGTFQPMNNMTRFEVASMFYALIADPDKAAYQEQAAVFSDTSADAWYSEAVGYLVAAGVLSGYPDGTFKGDNPIVRSEFVKIASKFGALNLSGEIQFPDVVGGHWAYDFIRSAYNNGWITGYPNGNFGPADNISRGQAVVIINRMLDWDADTAQGDNPFSDMGGNEWYYKDVLLAANGKNK